LLGKGNAAISKSKQKKPDTPFTAGIRGYLVSTRHSLYSRYQGYIVSTRHSLYSRYQGVYSVNQTLPLQQVSGVYSFNQTLPLQQVSGVYRNSRGRWGWGEKLDFKRFSYFLNFFIQKLIILT